ncbi:hypothetical protein PDIG_37580 [Penicillium digitatum PHI26]|uniref:Uncharacterized protein n=2 Tax=Penicillium digitatum TaxID=36651 RepID=K9FWP8_PEND2|nr:hypothetical protein PDIP_84170 [Penicillium digitatum Pd1]EKV05243.1 hypothetical protein PDIP_84170 [Penicillium digitatum Pd1]EKV13569.1 hypothetical protein PDIG_37580 [Penicillium digitatum PHI26]
MPSKLLTRKPSHYICLLRCFQNGSRDHGAFRKSV